MSAAWMGFAGSHRVPPRGAPCGGAPCGGAPCGATRTLSVEPSSDDPRQVRHRRLRAWRALRAVEPRARFVRRVHRVPWRAALRQAEMAQAAVTCHVGREASPRALAVAVFRSGAGLG